MKTMSFCALSLCATSAMAASAEDTFENGNRAFANSDYAQAIAAYQSLVDEGHYSESVLFNLGNAYAKAGQLGPAVLNYKRALFMAPRDQAARANLVLTANAASKSTWYESAAHCLSMSTWSFFSFSGFMLVALAALFGRLTSRRKSAWALALTGGASILAATAALAIWWPALDQSVVMEPAQARLSPFASAQPEFSLSAGQTVTVKRTHAGFALVATEDGQSGWVEAKLTISFPWLPHPVEPDFADHLR